MCDMNIAPFRGFIQQRLWEHQQHKSKKDHLQSPQQQPPGDMVLFFGCRYKDKDFLYGEWLQNLHEQKKISLFSAFSREKNDQKIYVQHLLQNEADLLWDLLHNRDASLYICGDAKHMEVDVKNSIVDIIRMKGGLERSEALSYLHQLEKSKRFQKDTWF
eukprot:TRINITY_DN48_c0_g1_i1.p1 TRINITY_DN48_c0_g1~~TRINITY_DN48_c0_g1_i1.p1  ORF type:complete len:160 (-),score=20.66 TRINITY_DN48_c0_g1_i1:118-597(-)